MAEPPNPLVKLAAKRTAEMAAIFMIGDGILGLLQPRRHVALWRSDVPAADALVEPFADRPARRRGYGLIQIAGGLWLATRLRALQG